MASVGTVLVVPDQEALDERLVVGQLSLTANSTGYPSYFEEELEIPVGSSPGIYQGTALKVKASPVIALRSLAAKPQTVTVTCLSEHGSLGSERKLQLAPSELQIVAACNDSGGGQGVIAEEVASDPISDPGAVGVSIRSTGTSSDLAAYGFAPYRDERGSFFSALDLTNPDSWASSSTVFAGVPLGRTPLFPGTNFRSQVGVSNFGTRGAEVVITVARTISAVTEFVPTNSTDTSQETIQLFLPAGASRTVDLPVRDDLPLTNSILLSSNAEAGTLTSRFVAWGDSSVRTFELVGKDSNTFQNGRFNTKPNGVVRFWEQRLHLGYAASAKRL